MSHKSAPRKPARWAFSRGLIEPGWEWFWNSMKGGSGLLEGQGTPHDAITGEAWNMDLGTGTAPWAPQTFGTSIDLPGVSAGSTAVATSEINHNVGTGEFTICTHGRVKRVGTTFDGLWGIGNFSPAIYMSGVGAGGAEWGMYWGGNKASGDILPLNEDVTTSFVAMRRAGFLTMFRDGAQTPTTHEVADSMANSAVGLGSDRSGSAASFGNCSVGAFSLHDIAFTDDQVRQWSQDPYGPFRMDADVGVVYPVAPAPGGSIPIFMHHYKQMAASA